MSQFTALQVSETPEGQFERRLIQRDSDDLPAGEVLIKVAYSSLNYKDALSATGNRGVTRHYPHTPGIDAAGTVAESSHPALQVGESVLVTGYDLGMNTDGGFAEYIRVPAAWVVRLPQGLSLQQSMIYGTAGFTAALGILKMEQAGLRPEQGEVLVTGASGGVGSLAVALLAKLGYIVVAVSGKKSAHDWLIQLGASRILSRSEALDDSGKPLLRGAWAGVFDTVGGDILATALKTTKYGGVVSCCGLVASPQLNTSVFPFILRGISLLGVDSVDCPREVRETLWNKLAGEWRLDGLAQLMTECDLETLNTEYIDKIIQAQVRGRVVVKLG